MGSGTPYTELGASASDKADGDISGIVQISGSVDRNKAGTYAITYKVKNSAGLEATATRSVRVIAPREVKDPSVTYNFNSSGKAVCTITHKNVIAKGAGSMGFSVTSIDKNMTIRVEVVNQTGGAVVFSGTYTALTMTQFPVTGGTYDVKVTILTGNGNTKYAVRFVSPEIKYLIFDEEETKFY